MRSLRAMICLVATLVVVGLPCVSRACAPQASAAGKVEACVCACALDATSHDAPVNGAPVPDAPAAPSDEGDANDGHVDGIEFDALLIAGCGPLSGNNAPGQRIVLAGGHTPAACAPETSPRPPRV